MPHRFSAPETSLLGDSFAGKRIAVLGLARSGLVAAQALLQSGAKVAAWDRQENGRLALSAGRLGDRVRLIDPLELDLTGFDAVVVSPGVQLNTHPIADHAARYGVPIIGDIELFAMARHQLPAHKVVGITGTNGKSTTTALVYHILTSAGVPAIMGGNIGLPLLSYEPLPEGGVYVLELSSYQIDLTHTLDCDAAVLLNVSPDHLDRYDNFADYAASKARLFAMQKPDHLAAFGSGDEPTLAIYNREAVRRPEGRAVPINLALPQALQPTWSALKGPHNLENVGAAIAIVEELGISRAQWEPALVNFEGLSHRMERVLEHDGVLFVNDSKATNTASAAPALAAWPADPKPRIHWIVGGLAKESGLGACEDHLANVACAYTIGDAGPDFAKLLEGRVPVQQSEIMSEAVRAASQAAREGDVILLAPACASFDQYRDFEKRGDAFREIALALSGKDAPSFANSGNRNNSQGSGP